MFLEGNQYGFRQVQKVQGDRVGSLSLLGSLSVGNYSLFKWAVCFVNSSERRTVDRTPSCSSWRAIQDRNRALGRHAAG